MRAELQIRGVPLHAHHRRCPWLKLPPLRLIQVESNAKRSFWHHFSSRLISFDKQIGA